MSEPSRDAVAEAMVFAKYCERVSGPGVALGFLHDEVRRLEAELGRRGAAPDKWRLVPVEPTAAMRAAFRADEEPRLFFFTTLAIGDFDQRYRAMLDASPAPDAAPTVPDGLLREAREALHSMNFLHGARNPEEARAARQADAVIAKLDAALSALLDAPRETKR